MYARFDGGGIDIQGGKFLLNFVLSKQDGETMMSLRGGTKCACVIHAVKRLAHAHHDLQVLAFIDHLH